MRLLCHGPEAMVPQASFEPHGRDFGVPRFLEFHHLCDIYFRGNHVSCCYVSLRASRMSISAWERLD